MIIHYIEGILKEELDVNFLILSKLKVTLEEKLSLLVLPFLEGLVKISFYHEEPSTWTKIWKVLIHFFIQNAFNTVNNHIQAHPL